MPCSLAFVFLLQEARKNDPDAQPHPCPLGARLRPGRGDAQGATQVPGTVRRRGCCRWGSWRRPSSPSPPASSAHPPGESWLLWAPTHRPVCVPSCPRAPPLRTRRSAGVAGGRERVPGEVVRGQGRPGRSQGRVRLREGPARARVTWTLADAEPLVGRARGGRARALGARPSCAPPRAEPGLLPGPGALGPPRCQARGPACAASAPRGWRRSWPPQLAARPLLEVLK